MDRGSGWPEVRGACQETDHSHLLSAGPALAPARCPAGFLYFCYFWTLPMNPNHDASHGGFFWGVLFHAELPPFCLGGAFWFCFWIAYCLVRCGTDFARDTPWRHDCACCIHSPVLAPVCITRIMRYGDIVPSLGPLVWPIQHLCYCVCATADGTC